MRRPLVIASTVVCAALLGVATNVGSAQLPQKWGPYLWLAWPVAGILALGLIIVELRRDRPETAAGGPDAFHRRTLLQRVELYWVKNVLDRSVYHEARIELGLISEVTANHPWDVVARRSDGESHPVPPGTPVRTVFDELNQSMLILGEPGAGKTTTMLELLRDLIAAARSDRDEPIPVVLNLSSWAIRREALGDWLVREVATRYEIPARYVQNWLDGDQLLPLLDGLDEVQAEHRPACVRAINHYRAQHGSVPVAVCCRTEEYAELRDQLRLYGTVTIQPLTRAQVDAFLNRAGDAVAGVRAALAADPGLWRMVESPLMLSVMALAFRDTQPAEPHPDEEHQQEQIFTAYVRTMLRHRPNAQHPPAQTVDHLRTLAQQMRVRGQTVFTIDLVGPMWLPLRIWRSHRWLSRATAAIWCAAGAAVLATIGALGLGWRGAAVGAAFGAAFGVPARRRIDSFRSARRQQMAGWHEYRTTDAGDWIYAIILPFVITEFRWPLALAAAGGLAAGPVLGGSLGIPAMTAYGTATALAAYLGATLGYGFAWAGEWVTARDSRGEVPSPRVRAALRPGTVAALFVGIAVFAATSPIVGWPRSGADGVRFGLVAGAGAALYAFSCLGGYAIVEQALLRRWLHRIGTFPLPARPLLDYAVQCLFLRQVGGGYIFVHRELLDFFASRRDDKTLVDLSGL